MTPTVRASEHGLELARQAVKTKRWGRQSPTLCRAASVSLANLKRFWGRIAIGQDDFVNICNAIGVNWEEIAECSEIQAIESLVSAAITGSVQSDPHFVGRESAIADLHNLVNQGAKLILVHAKGGVGKTTLARKYLEQQCGSCIEFRIATEPQNITSVESLIEEQLKHLGEEPGREFGVSLDRLKRKLKTERIGVLIDNLEPALDGNRKIIEPHRRYVELLTTLAEPAVQSVTLITSRECLRESAVTVRHYHLEGLDVAAWQEFFNSRQIHTSSPPFLREVGGDLTNSEGESCALSAMHKAYGGNAKAMDILSSAILQDYDGNLEAYWQANQEDLLIERELEDLVTCQFNRLQQLDSTAYQLLCRLGCYRYQDVPTVPEQGLFCLLWDVPEAQHRRVVKSLRDRSLVEFKNGDYWLHPVIRAETITRLRSSKDWETANNRAAQFWTKTVKKVERTEDALKALEACYHYLGTKNFAQACSVILNSRDSEWGEYEILGRSFYRLGLFNKMISVISLIIDEETSTVDYYWSELYNVLGSMYWLTGQLHKASKYYERGYQLAVEFDLEKIKLLSLLNIYLVKIDFGELEEALNLFYEYNKITVESSLAEHISISWFCLAFLNSILGCEQEAYHFAEQSYGQPPKTKAAPWHIGYRLVFLGATYKNLNNVEKSFKMYRKAISFAEASHYTQVKAKAKNGLAELYREQGDFDTALSHHSEGIELLDKIGAKCDLAEAYYQLGLTYQKMGNIEESQENFDKAIQLFEEMEAPKQVEKVRRAMEAGK
ncbi:MAG: tetratricopeptide repeat protein [Coleofasciculus sp. S288]|nr:tetratricopeptide repeat protein [Coleofasciculus sp. S288]